jgi:exosortase/archaeosortase family protein
MEQTETRRQRAYEWVRVALVWGCTAVLFWPAFSWLTQRTLAHDQLKQAFLLLAFALVYLLREKQLPLQLDLSGHAKANLLIGYALMAAAIFFKQPLAALGACCFVLAGFIFYLWGTNVRRIAYALIAASAVFVCLTLVISKFDWPLRLLAGLFSAMGLGQMDPGVSLYLIYAPGPHLLLQKGTLTFEVAPECNGFGIVASCVLLAILLLLTGNRPWLSKAVRILAALVLGILMNVVRILTIVLLAPHAAHHYSLMHEAVGYITLLLALGAVWWFSKPPR